MSRRWMRRLAMAALSLLLLTGGLPLYPVGNAAADTGEAEYVRIKNMYTGHYLLSVADSTYDKVGYAEAVETDRASHWQIEEAAGQARLKNRETGLYMSTEGWIDHNSPVVLVAEGGGAVSDWNILNAVTAGHVVIQSAEDSNHYLHMQDDTGYAQASSIPPDWGTVQWKLEPITEYVTFRNGYTGHYLMAMEADAGSMAAKVGYGEPDEADPAAHWIIEERGDVQRIQNRLTGLYMSAQNWQGHLSPVELLQANAGDDVVEWRILDGSNVGQKLIQSTVVLPDPGGSPRHIHVQDNTGYAQLSDLPANWGTPQWWIEAVTVKTAYEPEPETNDPGYIRIKNDWLELYLYEENGKVLYGNALASDARGQWAIEEEDGYYRIRNRASGHYVSLNGVPDGRSALVAEGKSADGLDQLWQIDHLYTAGNKLLRAADITGHYVHVENRLGFAQYGEVPKEWGSPQWRFIEVQEDEAGYMRLRNSYTGNYLFEEDGKVKYGAPELEDASSHWLIADAGGGLHRIQNRQTGHYIHVEGMQGVADAHLLPLNSGEVELSWTSAKWTMKEHQPGVVGFKNAYQTNQLIHVQDGTGYAQSSDIPDNWGSAQWVLEEAPDIPVAIPEAPIRLRNLGANQYLLENAFGAVLYGAPDERDASAHWRMEEIAGAAGQFAIVNRATGHAIAFVQGEPFLTGLAGGEDAPNGRWHVEQAPGGSHVLLRSAARPLEYMHLIDRTGYAQLELRSIEAAGAQWAIELASDDFFVPELSGASGKAVTGRIDDTRPVALMNGDGTHRLADAGPGGLTLQSVDAASASARWLLQEENGYKLLRNVDSGRYLAGDGHGLQMAAASSSYGPQQPELYWEMTERSGRYLFVHAATGKLLRLDGAIASLQDGNDASPLASEKLRLQPLASDVVFQAEHAFLTGGAEPARAARGYSGDGFAAGLDVPGAAAVIAVYADAAGQYDSLLRYASGLDRQTHLTLEMNGLPAGRVALEPGEDWDDWRELPLSLSLRQGLNTVQLKVGQLDGGGALLDRLTVNGIVSNVYRGASVPYDRFEAEHAATNGRLIEPDRTYRTLASEASGRGAIALDHQNDYVEFVLNKPANRITIRYSIPDAPEGGGLSTTVGLYADGAKLQDAELTSRYSWVYGTYPWTNDPAAGDGHRFYDESSFVLENVVEAGGTIRLQKDAGVSQPSIVIDLIEAELADGPYEQPAEYLSIVQFGATANDESDDTAAIRAAIEAGRAQGKGVWIPAGVFRIGDGPIALADVTIRGAGKWHSVLAGGGFIGEGSNIRVFDLALDVGADARRDDVRESGFDGAYGTGSTIQQVRIDHAKTGIWVTRHELPGGGTIATDGMYIAGVQIRNTFADGINFSSGTNRSMAEQNQLRNTGDDGLAMWANGEQSTGNTFRFNTVELPWLSNNIAVYGGKDVTITDNVATDTVAFGAGISISTRHQPFPYEGTSLVARNTMLRTGSREHNWPADFGALFLFAGDRDMDGDIRIADNIVRDSTYQGISLLGERSTRGIVLERNVVDRAGTWGIQASGNIKGSALFGDTIVRGVRVGEWVNTASQFVFDTFNEGFAFANPAWSLRFDGDEAAPLKLVEGATAQAEAIDEEGTSLQASWSVADAAIAKVDASGFVTGVRAGETLLRAEREGAIRTYRLIVSRGAAPSWPANAALEAVASGNGTVTVSWPSLFEGDKDGTYRIVWPRGFKTVSGAASQTVLTGFGPGNHLVRVEAKDAEGNWTVQALARRVRIAGAPAGGLPIASDGDTPQPGDPREWTVTAETTVREDGRVVSVAKVASDALAAQLDRIAAAGDSVLTLSIGGTAAAAEAVLPGEAVRTGGVKWKNGALAVKYDGAVYRLTLEALANVLEDGDEQLRLTIERLDDAALGQLPRHEAIAPNSLKSGLYRFALAAESGEATRKIERFDNRFAQFQIPVAEDVRSASATGMLFDETTGAWRPVPTVFRTLDDGTHVAIVYSVAGGIVAIADAPRTFDDVAGHWAVNEVHALASRRVVAGDGRSFEPNRPVTRAEFALILTNALGLPAEGGAPFADTAESGIFEAAIGAAAGAGIIAGYKDGTFRPEERVTREQVALMLLRAYRLAGGAEISGASLAAFGDASQVSGWAADAMERALALGVLRGRASDRLAPQAEATRAEAAVMILNMMDTLGMTEKP